MSEASVNKPSWTKQCAHCFRLLGEDGCYHSLGLAAEIAWFPADPRAESRLRAIPSTCPECFEALRTCLAGWEEAVA